MAVLGGDERQCLVAEFFASEGQGVNVYGVSESVFGTVKCESATEAVRGCGTIVFPLPAAKNSIYLNEKSGALTPIEMILDAVEHGAEIYAGKTDSFFKALCRERELSLTDYYESESFTVKNAQLTAEGALDIFMTEKKISVHGSRILVIGSGRVAKCVARVFSSLGAEVTVMARNRSELAMADVAGYKTRDITDGRVRLAEFALGYDAVINTVPVMFMTGCCLYVIPDETLVIDLASSPYGIDITEARRIGIRAVRASSLPGKYAPVSAARIIVGEIMQRMRYSGGAI